MKKHKLECVYTVKRFTYHKELKLALLSLLDTAKYENIVNAQVEANISKTDWFDCTNFNRDWFKFIKEPLTLEVLDIYKDMNYGGFRLNEIWFQQYLQQSEHGWHVHSANFTNVYYVELPEGTSKTQLIEPYSGKLIELDVEEGDIVSFPSMVLHRGPPNTSDKRKTIISFNTDVIYSDDIYGQGIK
jgi:hypothetical protein